jgi:hypothetical protein
LSPLLVVSLTTKSGGLASAGVAVEALDVLVLVVDGVVDCV